MILKGERLILRMRHEGGLTTMLGLPGTPDCGWYAPAFGTKEATTRILFKGSLAPDQEVLTHLFWAS